MLASDAIVKLQELITTHGDFPLVNEQGYDVDMLGYDVDRFEFNAFLEEFVIKFKRY